MVLPMISVASADLLRNEKPKHLNTKFTKNVLSNKKVT